MIIAANFKCNHTRAKFEQYANKLDQFLSSFKTEAKVIVAVPASTFLQNRPKLFIQAAQNFYPCQNGAFTGEIGLEQLDEFGIDTVILGHCERRNLGENDEFLASKFDFAAKHNMQIIYCIGESLQVYEDKQRLQFCLNQLRSIDLAYERLIIAYEPIYSIGKSAASLEDIDEMMQYLRAHTKVPLLYGGSVNKNNINQISKLCDGVLVGSASLEVMNFIDLIQGACE